MLVIQRVGVKCVGGGILSFETSKMGRTESLVRLVGFDGLGHQVDMLS